MKTPRRKAAPYSDDLLRLAARLYYIDGLGQSQVARFTRVSQAKISRMLAIARERGIVTISVAEYDPRHPAMQQRLLEEFGLKQAAVIKTIPEAGAEDHRQVVGRFGASIVAALIPRQASVAVAGGRTIRQLVNHLPQEDRPGATVIQAMGSLDSNVTPVDAMEIGRMIARRWKGAFTTLNTPAFVPDKKMRDSFLALGQIREVWRRLKEADVAIVGIGTLANSIFVERGVLSKADIGKLRQLGAVGEICGRFFDSDGRECQSPWRDRVVSIELEQLRHIPQVIGVVSGEDRTDAIAAAIRGGILKSLVIDDQGAAALLSQSRTPAHSRSTSFKGTCK